MRRLLLLVSLLLVPIPAYAIAPVPSFDESHSMSVSVNGDGSANVFLRVDGLSTGGAYRLTLPEGSNNDSIRAWYRQYPLAWALLDASHEGNTVRMNVPKTKGTATLGISWAMKDVTDKMWWGRTVTIETPTVDHIVSYTNVAVSFPDGVYVRDKATGPEGWGDMMSGVALSQGANMMEAKGFAPQMFDRAGGEGDVYKNKANLSPGESYTFALRTATSRWKLFVPEIATMTGVAAALTLVVSLLLRLLLGKKPFVWYASVVALCFVLAGLLVWLFRMYTTVIPRPEYPVMMQRSMDAASGSMQVPRQ